VSFPLVIRGDDKTLTQISVSAGLCRTFERWQAAMVFDTASLRMGEASNRSSATLDAILEFLGFSRGQQSEMQV